MQKKKKKEVSTQSTNINEKQLGEDEKKAQRKEKECVFTDGSNSVSSCLWRCEDEGGGDGGGGSLAPLPALTGKQLLGRRRWDEREGAMVAGGGKTGGKECVRAHTHERAVFLKCAGKSSNEWVTSGVTQQQQQQQRLLNPLTLNSIKRNFSSSNTLICSGESWTSPVERKLRCKPQTFSQTQI